MKSSSIERSHAFIIWILLIGIFIPSVPIPIGPVNFTPARIVVCFLLAPALVILLKNTRQWLASDFFAFAAAAWMLMSSILNGGFRAYVAAEALDFLGPYLVGRAFFFGPANLQTFLRAFRFVAVSVIALAVLDVASGRYFTLELFGLWPPHGDLQQMQAVKGDPRHFRATSVFPNTISYGAFCAAAAAIFLYGERTTIRRLFYASISFFGCALAVSSGPLLGAAAVAGCFCYDRMLKQYPWKWKLLTMIIVGLFAVIFLISNNPIVWVITHLTFNPGTGFARYTIWVLAMDLVSSSPWLGYGLSEFKIGGWQEFMLSLGVDCVWLVETIRYGVPGVLLLALTILSPFFARNLDQGRNINEMRSGLSLAIVALTLIGFTVHYWDTAWMFFFLCVGIRASFAEAATRQRVTRSGAALANMERVGAPARVNLGRTPQ